MTLAHQPIGPAQVWDAWNGDPLILILLLLVGFAYQRGARVLAAKGRELSSIRMGAFYSGLFLAAAALLSPLDAMSHTLFSAHMVQHLVLILLVPPLVVLGSPSLPLLLSLPAGIRSPLQRFRHRNWGARSLLAAPLVVWTLHTAALWAWHLPALYEAGLRSDIVHALEHASFFLTALLVWVIVIPGAKQRPRFAEAAGLTFATILQSGALGAILTFATTVLYPSHKIGAALWGLTPLQDQQLAGVIMWIPAGAVYFLTLAVLFATWLNQAPADMSDPVIVGANEK
jgi:putative membrane protein